MSAKTSLAARMRKIRFFFCDVDGVLTDATVIMGGARELKQFNIQDGLGLVLLRRSGIKVGWISSRPSPATTRRAHDLNIDFLVQTRTSKVAAIDACLQEAGGTWEEVCYVGDDLVDLGPLSRAGVAVAVENAVSEVKEAAAIITRKSGGHGAIREIAEHLLKAQGRWKQLVRSYYQ